MLAERADLDTIRFGAGRTGAEAAKGIVFGFERFDAYGFFASALAAALDFLLVAGLPAKNWGRVGLRARARLVWVMAGIGCTGDYRE